MRLLDLDPRWLGINTVAVNRLVIGVSFRCPHCESRLAVQFKPPIDPDNMMPSIMPPWQMDKHIWDREGDTFDTLTLKPSIDASESGHWHGFITTGEIKP